jgi:hypothetical protein
MSQARLVEALKNAVAVVDDAKVPNDLREAAFVRALDELLGRISPIARPSSEQVDRASEAPTSVAVDDDGGVGRIAKRLHIGTELAARIFDVDEDGLHLLSPRSAFDTKRLTATQQVATLVVAGRQAAISDEGWTEAADVRAVADKKGVLDPANFAKAINALDGQGMRIRGNPRNREIKMNDHGFELAGQLAARLVNED